MHHQCCPHRIPFPAAVAALFLAACRGRNRSYQPVNLDRIRTDNETSGERDTDSPPNSARRSSIGSRSRSRSRSATPAEGATKANMQV